MKFQSLGATLLSFAIAVPAYVSAQETANVDTLALSLDQCIAIALDDNPAIKIADMEIERVDYSKKEIIGQLLPSISFDATYSRTVEKQVAYMNMSAFKGLGGSSSSGSESSDESTTTSKSSGNNGIKMGLDNSYAMGFTAAMPIIAPQLWKTLKLLANHAST